MAQTTESRFRVRYAETDQMGMAYYANYLVWMEAGRSDYCRECGFSYGDLERNEQAFLTVAEASCRSLTAARYDDEILVQTGIRRLSRRVVQSSYRLKEARALSAVGR